ncbi:ATP12 family chaperone protein [Roseovarius indicus]|jgi:chaperone required for assembly of F1-ATPase|uniref:ATP12 chaperone protein n=1 Tax=Roseovarius indicus TaxID=540747 RepID=A0A0T5PEV3_9RHOB|nr:ATP12 family protein [Roseovarius indicus]KRS19535.1 ATPase [Roseovarius indicus]OAO08223.1 ATPase [Roseovarius indicus]QEW29138.1 ATP12 chaperone protein [Roseovarius indicus]SFD79202.1 Chaperone required for the assembly of the F1-ATPase [Roseovarius indicus]
MSEWKAKRFWKEAQVVEAEGGFAVELDGRPVRTPLKSAMTLPSRAMAEAVAAEWDAQEGEIKPVSMPVTRAANAAIDKVTRQHGEVAEMLAAYGDSDLLCYRADSPQELVERQAEAWDPLLDWADATFGARLIPVEGVMHAPQNPRALERLAAPVHAMDAFRLTAFHDLVGISGSLVIGLAAIHEVKDIGTLWRLSRIDETWQEEQWGIDEDARAQAAMKESDFYAAKRFHDLAHAA